MVFINTVMKVEEIRKRLIDSELHRTDARDGVKQWVHDMSADFPFALTLTLKQSFLVSTPKGNYYRKLDRDDCQRAAERFQQKLNRAVFGKRAADEYGKGLRYLAVLEGGVKGKHLHLHYALGGLPPFIRLGDLHGLIDHARSLVPVLDDQFRVKIADDGWHDYITKQAHRTDVDCLLVTLSRLS